MKLLHRISALLLCLCLLGSTAYATEEFLEEPDTTVSETSEVSEPIETQKPSIIEEESPSTIQPMASRTEALTSYDMLSISGKASSVLGELPRNRTETFPSSQWYEYSATTQYYYDSSQPITVTFYKYGSGTGLGFKNNWNRYSRTSSAPYDYVFNPYGDAVGYKFDEIITGIDPGLSELTLESTARSTVTPLNIFNKTLTIQFNDTRVEAPTTPRFILDPNNPEQFLLTGVDETMEYRLSTEKSWTTCTGNNIPFAAGASKVYEIRVKATEDSPESKYGTLTLPGRRGTPSVSVNWVDESFKNLTTDMEIAVNDGAYIPVTSEMIAAGATPFLDGINGIEFINLSIRYYATDELPAGNVKTIKIYKRLAEPTNIVLNENTYVITGVSSSMEYKRPEDTSWKALSSSSINLSDFAAADREIPVQFRMKSTSTASVSKPMTVTLPPLSPAPVGLAVDFSSEKITGFQSGYTYQYRIGTGNWSNVSLSNLAFTISNLISSSDRVMSIRIAGTTNTRLSDVWQVTLSGRAATPTTCKFVYNDPSAIEQAVLIGVSQDIEYKVGSVESWAPCTSDQMIFDLPTSNTTYYFRVKATSGSFASKQKSVYLLAPATAPSDSYNRTTEIVKVSATMEYSLNGGTFTTLEGTTDFPVTGYIESLSGVDTYIITLRYFATETKPASKTRDISISGRTAAPTTVTYSPDNQSIAGATTAMQYREAGTSVWNKVTAKTFSISSLLNGREDVVLEFRYAPTSSQVASHSQVVNCF